MNKQQVFLDQPLEWSKELRQADDQAAALE